MSRVTQIILLVGGTALLGFSAILLLHTSEYYRIQSPDGRFYAVATYPTWQSFIPMSPGSGGDHSGHVTVYTRDRVSCGRVPVDLVWMIRDIQWSKTNAELPLVAEWNLVNRTVEFFRNEE